MKHTSFWRNPNGSIVVVCICIAHGFEEDPLKICILSCFVSLKGVLFNLLCVYDLFQNASSQLCFRLKKKNL